MNRGDNSAIENQSAGTCHGFRVLVAGQPLLLVDVLTMCAMYTSLFHPKFSNSLCTLRIGSRQSMASWTWMVTWSPNQTSTIGESHWHVPHSSLTAMGDEPSSW